MNINNRNLNKLSKKIFFTCLVTFIYLLGRNLPLPLYDFSKTSTSLTQPLLQSISTMTGGSIESLSLFSLGLSPYMSTMIIWQLLLSIERFHLKKLSMERMFRMQFVMMFVIAIIQAIAIIFLQFVNLFQSMTIFQKFAMILILVTGSIFIYWLGNMNQEYGLGGSLFIIIIGISLNMIHTFSQLDFSYWMQWKHAGWIALTIICLCFFIWQILAVSQAEYRIPTFRMLIHEKYQQKAYLAVPLLLANGMQFMYAMVLYSLCTTSVQLLSKVLPRWSFLNELSSQLIIVKLPGITLYLAVICLLSFAFAQLNFNTQEISEGLQKSGDYLYHTMPGEHTKKKLDKILRKVALFESTYSCIPSGIPLIYTYFHPESQQYALSVTMIFILITMSFRIIQQVRFILEYDNTPTVITYVHQNK